MRLMATSAAFSRRGFLGALGGLAAGAAFSRSTLAAALSGTGDAPLFASAYRSAKGDFGVAILDEYGQILSRIALPARGHSVAVSPDRAILVAFARRPGTFAVISRLAASAAVKMLSSMPGRHFYGHGCFSADGNLLFAAENDYDAARGVIGVYDVSGREISRLAEFETYGTGPHDMLLSQDGKTLIVANGGIETHPDKGREKLNLESMSPSVVFIEASTGDLLAQHRLDADLHQVSLRHMALDGKGRVWVGGQFEGPATERPPLVVVMGQDDLPVLMDFPVAERSRLQNYIGSVAANRDGSVIATSAPRGGKTFFWRSDTGAFLGEQRIADGCGVAAIEQHSFLITDGNGGVSFVSDPGDPAEILARPGGVSWDNHLISL